MQIITRANELKEWRKSISGDKSVGFVPTMGALHGGHLSLIEASKSQCDFTVVSIFVNPTQFLPHEDLAKYPRKPEADTRICEIAEVDVLFMPEVCDIYPADDVKLKAPNIAGYVLEGYERPGHFDGVLTVVLKLLNLVRPTKAFFGEKDAQQLLLIKKMVESLFLDVHIAPMDTVREKDGLALSSRNVYLQGDERQKALALSDALFKAASMLQGGETDTAVIEREMAKILVGLQMQYVEITDHALNFTHRYKKGNTIIHVAAKVGSTRLIDNIWV